MKTKILKWDKNQVKKMHEKGDTNLMNELVEEGQKFMKEGDEEKINENLVSIKKNTKASGLSNVQSDGESPEKDGKPEARASRGDIKDTPHPAKSAEEQDTEKRKNKKKKRSTKYAKTVEKYHKTNKKILRMRELNRMKIINPFKGLKEILEKKASLEESDLVSVDSTNYRGYKGPKNEVVTQQIVNFHKWKL